KPWVPTAGPADELIVANPRELVICSYPGGTSAPRALSAEVSVHHGLAALAETLNIAPPGRLRHCPAGNGATNYLIHAKYADGTASWVTVTGCHGSSNGTFTSNLSPSGLGEAIAEQGSWGSPYPGDCSPDNAR